MPSFSFSQALTANQQGFNPLTGWQYEYSPFPAAVQLLVRATGVSVRMAVFSGAGTIQERSPVQAGGTPGVTPSPLNTPAITWIAQAGDRLKLSIDEVAAATPTVDGVIVIEPL